MEQSTVDYLWMLFDRDGLEHAVLAKRSTPDIQGYLDAACTRVLIARRTVRVGKPSERACPYCLCAVDEKVGRTGVSGGGAARLG